MSTILKALKKLESERAESDSTQTVDTRTTVNKHVKGIWLYNRLVTIVITAVVIIGGSWMFLNYQPDIIKRIFPKAVSSEIDNHTSEKANVSTEKTIRSIQKETPVTTIPHLVQPAKEMKAEDTEPIQKTTPKTNTENIDKQKATAPPVSTTIRNQHRPTPNPLDEIVHEPEANQSNETTHGNIAPAIVLKQLKTKPDSEATTSEMNHESSPIYAKVTPEPQKEPVVIRPKLIEKEIQDGPDKLDEGKNVIIALPQRGDGVEEPDGFDEQGESETMENAPDAELLKDDRIKIQALVWSQTASRRFAVINEQVVREGSKIGDSFTLKYIGNNFVIVEEGEQLWKVEFKGK